MGTLRDEMSKVLNEWDKQDAQANQPTTQENVVTKKITATQKIINIIATNAGISSTKVRQLVAQLHPEIPEGNVSSMLAQLTDRYALSREDSGDRINGKVIYNYTVLPEDESKRLREEADKKLKAAQARMERARQVKAAKQAAREAEEHEFEERMGLRDLLLQPEPLIKSVWTAKEALEGLNILQARELYDELKKIFGGN